MNYEDIIIIAFIRITIRFKIVAKTYELIFACEI